MHKFISRRQIIEWIPFKNFTNIKYIAEGGFGIVFKAIWNDGYIFGFDNENNKWKRHPQITVCLKRLNNSKFITEEFLNEVKNQHNYGVSKICEGQRPKIIREITKLLLDLMNECLAAEPQKRPSTKDLVNKLKQYRQDLTDEDKLLYKQIKEIDNLSDNNKHKSGELNYKALAIYKSQKLLNPSNTENAEIERYIKQCLKLVLQRVYN
ncbi:hypothetical protein C2G38_2035427 [Gigaspora rosea]|uniref:Protein kinase domain-containing protein n=1 Tax=Gigaspora rosea TaxID=44941 RepID=A0A397VCP2_9GLOM|nr:hypothetical protein C2G38_2035427 [Gigaspora rosea]